MHTSISINPGDLPSTLTFTCNLNNAYTTVNMSAHLTFVYRIDTDMLLLLKCCIYISVYAPRNASVPAFRQSLCNNMGLPNFLLKHFANGLNKQCQLISLGFKSG